MTAKAAEEIARDMNGEGTLQFLRVCLSAAQWADAAPLMTAVPSRLPVKESQHAADRDLLPNRGVVELAHDFLLRRLPLFSGDLRLSLAFCSAR